MAADAEDMKIVVAEATADGEATAAVGTMMENTAVVSHLLS